MKRHVAICLLLLSVPAGQSLAAADGVDIVSPHENIDYPRAAPTEGNNAFHIPVSFSATCFDKDFTFSWGFDDKPRGKAQAIDQATVQYTDKLVEGRHIFWVDTDCGSAKAEFRIR